MNRSTLHSLWFFNYPAEIIHYQPNSHFLDKYLFFYFTLELHYSWFSSLQCFGSATSTAFRWLAYRFVSFSVPTTVPYFSRCEETNLTKFNFSGCRIGFFLFFRGKEDPYLPYALTSGRSMLLVIFEVPENYCVLCYDAVWWWRNIWMSPWELITTSIFRSIKVVPSRETSANCYQNKLHHFPNIAV